KKSNKYHEIIVSFDKKEGFYEGNSLGIALTLSFLEQILKFYNPAYIINKKEQSAFTGGVTEAGEVLCTSEEIIKRKVAAVFFSEINSFVFSKCEETYAYFALTQLKKIYPNRKLKLIPVEEIIDVINRRYLVDVRKQKIAIRTTKFVKKNWVEAFVAVVLTIILSYLFVLDFDINPALLSIDGSTLFVKNRNGKILWTKKVTLSQTASPNDLKIIDINSDGINEVLVTCENSDNLLNVVDYATLRCYDHKGKLIWKYLFNDTVISKREELDAEYCVNILDTLTIYGKKSLYLFSQNIKSFSSVIFRIDLQTGKRLQGSFWCSGHTVNGLIKDINNDDKKDIVCIGFDNGYEDAVLFAFKIDTLIKVRPTAENYLICNFPVSEMLAYIRFPKNDYEIMFNQRFTVINGLSLNETKENDIEFVTHIYKDPERKSNLTDAVFYKVNKNLKNVDVFISNSFRLTRDTLVAHGKLKQPYTDTREYKNIIKSKILYYKNGKWVKREDLN
ncbi:MAG: hypothetical protein Q8M94_05530, partial [Ignavibacteria bacterium]|nr:hypothetical protein [Ignavibacteria bacterium]